MSADDDPRAARWAPAPMFNWGTVISASAVMIAVLSGGWGLFQTQLGGLEKEINQIRLHADKSDDDLRVELVRRETELRDAIRAIVTELERRRNEFPTQFEFRQFEKNMESRMTLTQKQIEILEQTRPSTAELQKVTVSTDAQLNRIEERVRQLEIYLREKK